MLICINQDDIPERNQQVQLMSRIYSQASWVRVWFGTGTSKNAVVTNIMHQLMEDTSILELQIDDRAISNGDLKALTNFLSCKWWTRIWVVQEAFLNLQTTIHYGDEEMDFSRTLATIRRSSFRGSFPPYNDAGFPLDSSVLAEFRKATLAPHRFAKIIMTFRDTTMGMSLAIACLRHLSASDPRDHVYGLLGLFEGARKIRPDYSLDVNTVFHECTFLIMRECGSLYLLSQASPFEQSRKPHASWCPNWSLVIDDTFGYNECPDVFNACRNRKAVMSLQVDGSLQTSGIIEDTVDMAGIFYYDRTFVEASARSIANKISEWRSFCGLPSRLDTKCNATNHAEDEFWATIGLGTDITDGRDRLGIPGKRYHPAGREKLVQWWQSAMRDPGRTPEKDLQRRTIEYRSKLRKKRLCRTTNGRLALLPMFAEPGDVICILAGAKWPFALRRIGKTTNRYTLVGDCYVHGIMDGEAVAPAEFKAAVRVQTQAGAGQKFLEGLFAAVRANNVKVLEKFKSEHQASLRSAWQDIYIE